MSGVQNSANPYMFKHPFTLWTICVAMCMYHLLLCSSFHCAYWQALNAWYVWRRFVRRVLSQMQWIPWNATPVPLVLLHQAFDLKNAVSAWRDSMQLDWEAPNAVSVQLERSVPTIHLAFVCFALKDSHHRQMVYLSAAQLWMRTAFAVRFPLF